MIPAFLFDQSSPRNAKQLTSGLHCLQMSEKGRVLLGFAKRLAVWRVGGVEGVGWCLVGREIWGIVSGELEWKYGDKSVM